MAENGRKWQEMAENGRKWQKKVHRGYLVENGFSRVLRLFPTTIIYIEILLQSTVYFVVNHFNVVLSKHIVIHIATSH